MAAGTFLFFGTLHHNGRLPMIEAVVTAGNLLVPSANAVMACGDLDLSVLPGEFSAVIAALIQP